jgi:hypothetical protein
MKYAVVTVGETYHIGNLDTHATMCDQPKPPGAPCLTRATRPWQVPTV